MARVCACRALQCRTGSFWRGNPIMRDVCASTDIAPKNMFTLRNAASVPGSLARTPMIRVEYHF